MVKDVRKSHISPHMTLLMKVLQSVDFKLAFFLMFHFVGFRDAQPRWDFLQFIITGAFLMIHASAVGAVFGADKP